MVQPACGQLVCSVDQVLSLTIAIIYLILFSLWSLPLYIIHCPLFDHHDDFDEDGDDYITWKWQQPIQVVEAYSGIANADFNSICSAASEGPSRSSGNMPVDELDQLKHMLRTWFKEFRVSVESWIVNKNPEKMLGLYNPRIALSLLILSNVHLYLYTLYYKL